MDKIVLGEELLAKMGVDPKDEAMVTGVKFMMVDTGMDEETVQMVSVAFWNGAVNSFLVSSFRAVYISHTNASMTPSADAIGSADYGRGSWRNGGRRHKPNVS